VQAKGRLPVKKSDMRFMKNNEDGGKYIIFVMWEVTKKIKYVIIT